MQVRLTTEADVERVMEIYHGAQAFMAAHGNPTQWRNAYPTPEIVREDIALRRGYVCEENGHLYAAFMLLEGEDPNYRRIDGAWLNDLPYQTLHRVASSGERKGMVDFIVQWALKRCENLRGDTHADNLPCSGPSSATASAAAALCGCRTAQSASLISGSRRRKES